MKLDWFTATKSNAFWQHNDRIPKYIKYSVQIAPD